MPLGYEGHHWLKARLGEFSTTRLSINLTVALFDHLLITFCGIVAYLSFTRVPLLFWAPCYFLLAVFAARQMRGLECLVHEASHYNWTRRKRLNDTLADLFAAWPVLSEVTSYRKTHLLHHRNLGSPEDTDLVRWRELRLSQLDRSTFHHFAIGIVRRLIPYVPGWWWAIGVSRITVIRFICWHLLWIIGATVLLKSPGHAVFLWAAAWLFPIFIFLPVLRFLGEIEEHDYENRNTVFSATNSNIGFFQTLLLHPHGDAYHSLHHLYPSIPFFRVGLIHNQLCEIDREGYGQHVPVRRRILG
jgi:fatty acid desaturase